MTASQIPTVLASGTEFDGLFSFRGAARVDGEAGWTALRVHVPVASRYGAVDARLRIKLDDEGKMTGIDYDYCKGCGLCAKVCPPKASAIEMVPERRGE